jgi:mRNA interferase RelE/StbE
MDPGARWQVETTPRFDRELSKLDRTVQKRVVAYLLDVAKLPDPRLRGKGLTASHREQWRYRVGDYRIIVTVDRSRFVILALTVAHRSTVH